MAMPLIHRDMSGMAQVGGERASIGQRAVEQKGVGDRTIRGQPTVAADGDQFGYLLLEPFEPRHDLLDGRVVGLRFLFQHHQVT